LVTRCRKAFSDSLTSPTISIALYSGGNLWNKKRMDYVSHGLWSYIFFHRIKTPLLAVCFGLLPDTASWVIYGLYRVFTGGPYGKPILGQIPDWTYTLYDISHSLVVAITVILIVLVILRRVPIYMFAWPIAIVMDLLTHRREFLPTPFLWPISDWKFPGISWGTWQFMLINYTLIAIAMALIIVYKRRKKNRTKI